MQLPFDRKYTYADYAAWASDNRRELIDGVPYLMEHGLSPTHQQTVVAIAVQLGNLLHGRACEVLMIPLDVRLDVSAGDDTVVQPDIVVICDAKKLENGLNCEGAPDMIIEVLSQPTIFHDYVRKFKKYRETGVKEYWIVDPERKIVHVHLLRNNEYMTRSYGERDTIPVDILKDGMVSLSDVFPADGYPWD